MAKLTTISNEVARAMLDAKTALLDTGGAGSLVIYDNTAPGRPANPDVAVTTQVAISTHALSLPAFAAAFDDSGNNRARALANAIAAVNAANSGTATWARLSSGSGLGRIDVNVGEAADNPDLILDNKNINAGQQVSITSFALNVDESS